ncbi:MFS transporter [Phenylobacterium sp.]|uniref:MFS transporter n=1 Tax=Phenylobacterium sp. TaxID=1871053 RepID=UPI002B87F058|nr:MFS transporter [Phenylobacterium sp.]HVI31456.1 MFS transporter [Phenylobacterium sp.]
MTASAPRARPTRTRHVVLWLTVAVYMITYMDRVAISAAVPSIQKEFGFSTVTIGWILAAFQLSYAMFQIPGGWLGDRFGPRRALSGVVVWWSIFTAATAFTWSAASMIVCRFLFGMGEAGAFPIATRSLSRWMLPSERGWAQGVTHAGSRLGGALTPVIAVALIAAFGWRGPFIIFALIGVVWAVVWFWYYRDSPAEHRFVNEPERELIAGALGRRSGPGRGSVPWKQILTAPQMWILAAMYACYGYSIGIYLSWFPKYLVDAHGFTLAKMGLYASLPLLAGVLGDIAGGWSSDLIVKRTGNLKMGRRIVAIVGFIVAGSMIMLAVNQTDPETGVAFFCLAVFGLELTVGVSWAVALDIGDEYAGSVSAVMNTAGNLGATVSAAATGYLVTLYGWSTAFGVLAGLAAVAAFLFLWIDASRRVYRGAEAVAAPA